MLEALIPYIVAPEKRIEFGSELPVLGDHITVQVFGLIVAIGVLIGINRAVRLFAKAKDIDEFVARDQIFWVLVFGFIISHEVSVIFYFPEKVREDPWVLLMMWNGLSSVGGFFGAGIGMVWYLWKRKQPILPYADMNIFGLLIGMCFGRAACAIVHDHPGKIVDSGSLFAVGPWGGCPCPPEIEAGLGWFANNGRHPDCCAVGEGVYRYDLGLMEFLIILALTLFVYLGFNWRKAAPGKLTGLVAFVYGFARFWLDFLRETRADNGVSIPDVRYAGLTAAQYFAIAFAAAGVYLLFIRKPKPSDLDYAKDSARIAKQNQDADEGSAAADGDADADGEGDAKDEDT